MPEGPNMKTKQTHTPDSIMHADSGSVVYAKSGSVAYELKPNEFILRKIE